MSSNSNENKILEKISNQDLEKVVLGEIILNKEVTERIIDLVAEEDFYYDIYRNIFIRFKKFFKEQKDNIQTTDITFKFYSLKENQDIGRYIIELINSTSLCFGQDTDYYLKELKELTNKRELFLKFREYQKSILLEENKKTLDFIADENNDIENFKQTIVNNDKVVDNAIDEIIKNIDEDDEDNGIKTYIENFDKIKGELKKGEFIIFGARPSVGKTAFAISIMSNLLQYSNKKIGFFSLEMNSKSIYKRFICNTYLLPSNSVFNTNELEQKQKDVLKKCFLKFKENFSERLYILDNAGLTISQLINKAYQLKRNKDVDIIFIDYLSLIKFDNNKGEHWERVGEISHLLKNLARELNIPVICLSQLNREAEKGKAEMYTLRYSGEIEHDADLIVFIEEKDKDDKDFETYYIIPGKETSKNCKNTKIRQLKIRKNRNGKRGIFELYFLSPCMKFVSPENCRIIDYD